MLCAPGRCAAEADARDDVRVSCAVVHDARLLDAEAELELLVHARHRLVPEARDFAHFKVALVGDAFEQGRQVRVEARREGRLEHAVGLGVILCDLYRAAAVENLGVDDDAIWQSGVVVVVLGLDGVDRVGADVCDDRVLV